MELTLIRTDKNVISVNRKMLRCSVLFFNNVSGSSVSYK